MASFAEANHIQVLSFAGKRDKGRPEVLAESPWPERKIDKVMPLIRKAAPTGRSQMVAIGSRRSTSGIHRDQVPDPHRRGLACFPGYREARDLMGCLGHRPDRCRNDLAGVALAGLPGSSRRPLAPTSDLSLFGLFSN